LAFDNQRKIGKVTVTPKVDEFVAKKKLGRDALQIDRSSSTDAMEKKKGSVKSTLMNQQTMGASEMFIQMRFFSKQAFILRKK